MASAKTAQQSVFHDGGIESVIEQSKKFIRELYATDDIPWVVGYSGGKDSTAALQLVWLAIAELPESERQKPVHIISTDTLVENPIVASWVSNSLEHINRHAEKNSLPFKAHRLTPEVEDTFWVNLIGKGYPAPRHKFRWCTERLKIKPSNKFIREVVRESGEAILVLGTRKAESTRRAASMKKFEQNRVREQLSPNASLPNCLVFSPLEDWSNDDVWLFLMQVSNPWGYRNKDLLTMYQGASQDGECPLVVDTTTPSCGSSRFGCWVCTLVEKDRSMQAMIQNDEEKEWMLPLLELRDALDVTDDKPLRDFRRLTGAVQLFHDRPIHGPYTQEVRANWLRRVLQAQRWARENGPNEVRELELVSEAELAEIRRIWVVEKHELEDLLPQIYEEEVGVAWPGASAGDDWLFGSEMFSQLKTICGDDGLHYELVRNLLALEWKYRAHAKRTGLFVQLDKEMRRGFYEDVEDATQHARNRKELLDAARDQAESRANSASIKAFTSTNTEEVTE